MSVIKVNGTKAALQQFAPKLASLMQGDWMTVDANTQIKIPDQIEIDLASAGGKTTITFKQPIPLRVQKGWGPFQANFSGTIQAVMEIDGQGAKLMLGGLPDQVLEWAP